MFFPRYPRGSCTATSSVGILSILAGDIVFVPLRTPSQTSTSQPETAVQADPYFSFFFLRNTAPSYVLGATWPSRLVFFFASERTRSFVGRGLDRSASLGLDGKSGAGGQ
ncbi:hypothetical protein BDU57DRAFT_516801 [Ampelomyces quisqualis]|uniref:Uncharacterized protein n=1 Tax=Ampelomyces quisqualis TaxID=50730 RepID=A0A6A5QPI1_AMPQU|nr:hypothetical protein BDU57DRAFT_516801 [Ampelomyces quisqualis]